MTYLAGWRLAFATGRLRDSEDTVGAIARQIGYGSAFSLSSAFKRVYGVSPQEHRTRTVQGQAAEGGAGRRGRGTTTKPTLSAA